MLPGPMGNKVERYALPARLAQGDVDELVVWLVRTGGGLQLTLDFTDTSHIDFRAVRALVERVREIHTSLPPIRIVGLDPYCEQILRYSLTASDWDLFETVEDAVEGEGTGEGAGAGASSTWEGPSWSPLAESWSPCPN